MSLKTQIILILAGLLSAMPLWAQAQWQPVKGTLMTRWAKEIDPVRVHPEYPRPQMVRKDWMNLNGLYLLQDGKYELQGEVTFTGKLINHPGTWTVGRGFHNGKLANDARAYIDEVRVSSIALPAELLLWTGESRAEN